MSISFIKYVIILIPDVGVSWQLKHFFIFHLNIFHFHLNIFSFFIYFSFLAQLQHLMWLLLAYKQILTRRFTINCRWPKYKYSRKTILYHKVTSLSWKSKLKLYYLLALSHYIGRTQLKWFKKFLSRIIKTLLSQ